MVTNALRRLRDLLAVRWAQSEADFTIATALDPYISNRAILYYLFPLPFLGFVVSIIPANHWEFSVGGIIVWYVAGFVLFASRAVRWNFQAARMDVLCHKYMHSANRLAIALAAVHRKDADYFEILEWQESVRVARNHMVRIVRKVKIRVGPRPLNVVWSVLESHGPEVSPDHISVRVHQIHDGARAKLEFDPTWYDNAGRQCSQIYIHTPHELNAHELFTVEIEWEWPNYLDHLWVQQKSELFKYKLTRNCAKLDVEIRAPRRQGQTVVAGSVRDCLVSQVSRKGVDVISIHSADLRPGDEATAKIQCAETKKSRT